MYYYTSRLHEAASVLFSPCSHLCDASPAKGETSSQLFRRWELKCELNHRWQNCNTAATRRAAATLCFPSPGCLFLPPRGNLRWSPSLKFRAGLAFQ